MGLTVTNTNTISLLNIVNSTRARQSNVLTQLSTGYKINRGADNPSGLIAMKSLEAELTAVNSAIDNNQRSNAMLTVADSAMNEISSLMGEIETLVMGSASDAGLSAGEKAANQSQIDLALSAIDRLVNTTTFNGKRLLDGSQAIATTNPSNYAAKIDGLRIYSRGTQTTDTSLTVKTVTAASQAEASFAQFATAGATMSGAMSVSVTGSLGSKTIEIASGSTRTQVMAAINASKGETGVEAVSGATYGLSLRSTGYGSAEFVGATVISGGDISSTGTETDFANIARSNVGKDATVTVNGMVANADGLEVSYNANGISLSFTMDKTAMNVVDTTTTITVSSSLGGAAFQLGTDASTRSTLGIDSLASFNLGNLGGNERLDELKSGGRYDLNTDTGTALKVIKKALGEVATSQGRVGAFQKFNVQTSINSLNAAKISLSDAKSVVADTDYAVAAAELNRQTVLLNSGISLLGLANQQASQIMSLLG